MSQLLIFIFLAGFQGYVNIEDIIDDVTKRYAPDKRISLFNISYDIQDNSINLFGETNKVNAKNDLLFQLDSLGLIYQDNIDVLPKEKIYGIINNSVGNLRGKPSHSSELVSQTLLGTKVKILKKEGEWYLIQTPEDYISWIDHGGISIMDEENYKGYYKNQYIYSSIQGFAYNSIERQKKWLSI